MGDFEAKSAGNDGVVSLTRELIHDCETDRGGFTTATVEAFGIKWRQTRRKGWVFRLVGKQISSASYEAAMLGRFVFKERGTR